MKGLIAEPTVRVVEGHMCRHGMTMKDKPVLKATGWCSNSPCILNNMHKLCNSDHIHADLQHGNAKHAAIWPRQLCLSILRGIREQLIGDGVMSLGGFGPVCEEKSYEDEIRDYTRNL